MNWRGILQRSPLPGVSFQFREVSRKVFRSASSSPLRRVLGTPAGLDCFHDRAIYICEPSYITQPTFGIFGAPIESEKSLLAASAAISKPHFRTLVVSSPPAISKSLTETGASGELGSLWRARDFFADLKSSLRMLPPHVDEISCDQTGCFDSDVSEINFFAQADSSLMYYSLQERYSLIFVRSSDF